MNQTKLFCCLFVCSMLFACDPVEDSEAGEAGAGMSGTAGAAGSGGEGGGAGAAGSGGAAGVAGSGGDGGTAGGAGVAGSGGDGGTAGAAGIAGSGGDGGTAGAAGVAGSGGDGGTAGAAGGDEPCVDVDQDRICDQVDSVCNADGIALSCRRAAPACDAGTVPETLNGCYTDRCVPWTECATGLPTDVMCGGRSGQLCDEGFFCSFPISASCGETDLPGFCVAHEPDAPCTREYFPVCGCDGQTYGNECEANRSATSVASIGACDSEPTVCGTRGAQPCPEGQYCKHPIEANCGRTDMPGVCTDFSPVMACTREFFPVCGCDGQTYSNPCGAEASGVSIDFEGPCESEGTACTLRGAQCGQDEFCFFPIGAGCGEDGAQGICKPVAEDRLCTQEYMPVCGCDGQTYGNECSAMGANVSIARDGECGTSCVDDAECGPEGWCRIDASGGRSCVPFQPKGASCGGFTPPEFQERCSPELMCRTEPFIPDLPGVCSQICQSSLECEPSESCSSNVCTPQGQMCGGFAGFACPQGQICVDDPQDSCDPNNGGADCMGICELTCTPDQCGQPPLVMQCPDGSGPGVTCGSDENGVCAWQVTPCRDAPGACQQDIDCGADAWCKPGITGSSCVPYARGGEVCNDPNAGVISRCNPATHHCAPINESILGGPSMCQPFCTTDLDCRGIEQVCIINPPCLSPAGNLTDQCFGYCGDDALIRLQ